MELSSTELESLRSKVQEPLDLRLPSALDLRLPTRFDVLQNEFELIESPLLSDSERAKRALEQYDEIMRKERFSVKSYARGDLARTVANPAVQTEPHGVKIDLNRKSNDWSQSIYDYNPYTPDQKGQQAKLQIERTRQRSFDKVADMIHPGFGRMEFKVGDNNVRFDYLNARRCRLRGAGLCLQIGFH
jgi:hypothetical protein